MQGAVHLPGTKQSRVHLFPGTKGHEHVFINKTIRKQIEGGKQKKVWDTESDSVLAICTFPPVLTTLICPEQPAWCQCGDKSAFAPAAVPEHYITDPTRDVIDPYWPDSRRHRPSLTQLDMSPTLTGPTQHSSHHWPDLTHYLKSLTRIYRSRHITDPSWDTTSYKTDLTLHITGYH